MKTCPVVWLAVLLSTGFGFPLRAQGTAFTYQGRLSDGAASATGAYDLRFVIHDAASGGNQHGPSLTNSSVNVSNGLFTVALDFGGNVFTGTDRWLEIAVRTSGGTAFSLLSPRQAITATPYAIKASVSSTFSGGLSSSNLAGTYGNPLALTNAANQFAGTFSGNGMNITNISTLSLIDDVPPVVAWGRNNAGQTSVPAGLDSVAALAGGGDFSLALRSNRTIVAWGAILQNQSNVLASLNNAVAIAAGTSHALALRNNGTVTAWGSNLQGQTNVPPGLTTIAAVAAGSSHSLALRSNGTVIAWGLNANGQTNVPAGLNNVAAVAGGGSHTLALRSNGTVVAWGLNTSGQTNVPAGLSNVIAVAAGGLHSLALRSDGTVVAWGANSFGVTNVPAGLSGVTAIAAGFAHNLARKSDGSVVAWGSNNDGELEVPARLHNDVLAIAAGGDHNLVLRTGRRVPALASLEEDNVFAGENIFAGPATFNEITATNMALFGSASFLGDQFTFAGNAVHFSSPAFFHDSATFEGTVNFQLASPVFDSATFNSAMIADLQISAFTGASGLSVTGNRTGDHVTPVALIQNLNTGASAPALRVVGAGSTPSGVLSVSTTGNGLIARFGNSSTWVSELSAAGNWSATAFNPTSDRNAKQEFEKVEPREVLEKVAALPISRWSFKQDPQTRHVGPMAQDFYAAFGVGLDDKHIATVDADGVALAAIQGLNQKVEQQRAEAVELKREIAELKKLVQQLTQSSNR
jgi:hypothetical protein